MTYDVIIIGGGLAGSAAAIRLARRGFGVLLLEKRPLPASKLCGEFLSPETGAAFATLGVEEAVCAAGAVPIEHTRVTTPGGAVFESALPGTARGLSRYRLDHLLFEAARAEGADARDGCAVCDISGDLANGFEVETDAETFGARVVFGAHGRRAALDRTLARAFLQERHPYVAFKAHYEGDGPVNVIELHAFDSGYCGISCVEEKQVNVCWIGRTERLRRADGDPEAMLARAAEANAALGERLRSLRRVEEQFEAVSQISVASKSTFAEDVCLIGDAAGMIAPLCGDGMAMALRSAALAVTPAADFLAGRCGADAFRARYEKAWKQAFALRMRLGRRLHGIAFRPAAAALVVRACRLAPPLGRWLVRKTRG